MRRVILMSSVSLDGFFADPDGGLDWQSVDEELHLYFNRDLAQAGAFLAGRVTYELMEGYWPTADDDPDASPAIVEFAGIWRDASKVVYSRTLDTVGANATIAREVVPAEVEALKAQPGGDLVVGGAVVAAEFMRLGLVDEFRVYVHPVVLGRGRPLFDPDGATAPLRLLDTRTFTSGVVRLRYERA